jgi:hypothetical protein
MSKRQCRICGCKKLDKEFSKGETRCRMCENERVYERGRENMRRLAALKEERGCADCPPGTVWPYYVLDFDHVRGEKSFNLGHCKSRSWLVILREVEKCEVVCSNHHRVRTQSSREEPNWRGQETEVM